MADIAVCSLSPSLAKTRSGRVNASAMVRADVASTLPEVFAQHPALARAQPELDFAQRPGQHLALDLSQIRNRSVTEC